MSLPVITFPPPPPTSNNLTSQQRQQLLRSTRKLTKLLGSAPHLTDQCDTPLQGGYRIPFVCCPNSLFSQPCISTSQASCNSFPTLQPLPNFPTTFHGLPLPPHPSPPCPPLPKPTTKRAPTHDPIAANPKIIPLILPSLKSNPRSFVSPPLETNFPRSHGRQPSKTTFLILLPPSQQMLTPVKFLTLQTVTSVILCYPQ